MPGSTVVDFKPAAAGGAPSGVSFYRRISVGGTAGSIGSFITGGIPSWRDPKGAAPAQLRYPSVINIALETGQGTDYARLTYDGQTTPTTTLGALVPVEPNFLSLPVPEQLAADTVKIIASDAATTFQVWFEA
jgi:hypothetical protein